MRKDVKRMTRAEWEAEGARRFGANKLQWRFVCPCCRNVQTAEDFRPYNAERYVTHNCLGRYIEGPVHKPFGVNGPEDPGRPCNYTAYGLFKISPVVVVDGDEEYLVFDFAEAEGQVSPSV